MPKKKVVVDPMGQWKYPGDITIIPSNNITMDGVNYPVLGIDNLGNQQMMMPGGSYTFPGDYVTEIPQMGKGGLTQWFAEEWTDIKTGKPCGRQKGENRAYPACRPKKRVNETTPKTTSEMSSAEKAKFKRSKTSGERISYNHKRKEYGGENWLDTYQDGAEFSTEEEKLVNKINAGRGAFRPKAPNYTPTYNDLVSMYESIPSYNSGYESLQDVDDRRAGVQRIGPLTKERTEQLAVMPSEQQLRNTYIGQTFGRLPVIEGNKIYEGYSPNRIWTGKDPWIPYKYEGDTTDKPSYMYMVVPKQDGNSWNWDRPTDTRGVNDFFFTDDKGLIDGTENPLWHMPKDLNVAEALFTKIGKENISKILNKEVSDFSDLTGRDWYQLSNNTGLSSSRWFGQQTPIYWNNWQPTRKEMLKDPRILKYSEANNLGLAGDSFISGDYSAFKPSTGYQQGAAPAFSNLLIESILAKKDAELNNRAIGHATGEGYGVIQDPNQFNLVGYLPVNDTLTNPYLEPMFKNAMNEDRSGAAYRNMVMDMAGVPIDEELRDRVLFHTNAFPIQEYKPAQQKNGGSTNWLDTYQSGGKVALRTGNTFDDEIFNPFMSMVAGALDTAGEWTNDFLGSTAESLKNNLVSSPFAPMVWSTEAKAKPWLFENVRPVQYPGIVSSAIALGMGAAGATRPPVRDPQGDYDIGEEAWRRALGLETKPKYIVPSKYKPSKSTNPDAQYYTLGENIIDPALIIAEAKKRNLQQGQSAVIDSLAPYIREGYMPREEFSQIDPLQKFTIGMGQDAKGKYVSIYDKYDFQGPLNSFINPYEFYDRYYYKQGGSTGWLNKYN